MSHKNAEYLSPAEVLEEYPFLVTEYNWSLQTPGVLLAVEVLHGKYLKGKHITLVTRKSVLRLLALYKESNDERNMHLGCQKPN